MRVRAIQLKYPMSVCRIGFHFGLSWIKKTSLSPGNSNLHRTLQFHRNEAFSVEISGVKGVLPPGNSFSFEWNWTEIIMFRAQTIISSKSTKTNWLHNFCLCAEIFFGRPLNLPRQPCYQWCELWRIYVIINNLLWLTRVYVWRDVGKQLCVLDPSTILEVFFALSPFFGHPPIQTQAEMSNRIPLTGNWHCVIENN